MRSRAARGDAAAFAVVYEDFQPALYRYCRSILRDDHDAQDALQSTMLRAFAALRHEERDFELRPWLFRIAHNEAISILRRRRPTSELDENAGGDDDATPDQVSMRADLRALQDDLDELPERQRAALVLRELNGLSHQEIASVLEITPGLAKQAIFQGRTALMQAREGREMACGDIRRAMSDNDGRVLRGGRLRGHLRACTDCQRFREELRERPRALAQLVPPLAVPHGAALIAQLLGAGGTASAGGAAAVSGLSAASAGSAVAAKVIAVVVVAATAAGGATVMRDEGPPAAPQPVATERSAPKPAADPPAKPTPTPPRLGTAPAVGTPVGQQRAAARHARQGAAKRAAAARRAKAARRREDNRAAAPGRPDVPGRAAAPGRRSSGAAPGRKRAPGRPTAPRHGSGVNRPSEGRSGP